MKKTLLTATLIAALSTTALTADAFCWRNLNPANWGTCPKCEKTASNCGCEKDRCNSKCEKKEKKCCPTKNPCQAEKPKCNSCQPSTCNPCDRLQNETER